MINTYFVKDGLINGDDGVYARTIGFGILQRDGWYFLTDDMEDGEGPFPSKKDAEQAGREYLNELPELLYEEV